MKETNKSLREMSKEELRSSMKKLQFYNTALYLPLITSTSLTTL